VKRRLLVATALVFLVFGTGPTVGDIGSCGQPADDLDATKFFRQKQVIDCRKCQQCALGTKACTAACTKPAPTAFPPGCRPLVHDGEVCLDALEAASCDDYASYVGDASPTAPSECQFCPVE
jgi:hypothetical protein